MALAHQGDFMLGRNQSAQGAFFISERRAVGGR